MQKFLELACFGRFFQIKGGSSQTSLWWIISIRDESLEIFIDATPRDSLCAKTKPTD